jgi:hypothetical protein
VRHRFVLSFGYELPELQSRTATVRLILGGWQVNGIVQAQTGFPLTVIEPNNVSLTSLTNRPDMTCDPNAAGARTTAQWFDTSCFRRLTVASNAGQIGNEPRNAVRGPGFTRTDVSLFKRIRIARSHEIQLRVEAFNVLNSARFNQRAIRSGLRRSGRSRALMMGGECSSESSTPFDRDGANRISARDSRLCLDAESAS